MSVLLRLAYVAYVICNSPYLFDRQILFVIAIQVLPLRATPNSVNALIVNTIVAFTLLHPSLVPIVMCQGVPQDTNINQVAIVDSEGAPEYVPSQGHSASIQQLPASSIQSSMTTSEQLKPMSQHHAATMYIPSMSFSPTTNQVGGLMQTVQPLQGQQAGLAPPGKMPVAMPSNSYMGRPAYSVHAQDIATSPVAIQSAVNEIDPTTINVKEITAQMDNGELPAMSTLKAIFKSNGELPEEIRNLKEHLLDRIINHKKLLLRALESKEDHLIEEIANKIHKTKDVSPVSDNPFADLPDGSGTKALPLQPELPLIVGFDPFLEKPKPSFFGRVRKWFSFRQKGPETNVGHYYDNSQGVHNSFGRHGAAWGRSTVYYPPLQYSSHLIPVSSGAFDLKRYDFRPYRPGHPRITRRRFVTRIILRRRDPPLRRNQIERDQEHEEQSTIQDHVKLDEELRHERDFFERNRQPDDSTDPRLAVPDPRLEEQYGFAPSKLYRRPLPYLDLNSRQIGYPGDGLYPTGIYTGPGNQRAKTIEEELSGETSQNHTHEAGPQKTS